MEIISQRCQWTLTKKRTQHDIVGKNIDAHSNYDDEVKTAEIDDMASDNTSQTIIFYAKQTLRTIALCYWDFVHTDGTDSSADDAVCVSL